MGGVLNTFECKGVLRPKCLRTFDLLKQPSDQVPSLQSCLSLILPDNVTLLQGNIVISSPLTGSPLLEDKMEGSVFHNPPTTLPFASPSLSILQPCQVPHISCTFEHYFWKILFILPFILMSQLVCCQL